MTVSNANETTRVTVENALGRYDRGCRKAAEYIRAERASDSGGPDHRFFPLPEAAGVFEQFYAASELSIHELGLLGRRRVIGLNLMRNPGTRTTKTFASLSIVARAVAQIRESGDRIVIITPTSGNKGTGLRDAVARAYACGLASPDNLRIVTVLPAASREKLRNCPLLADEEMRRINPVALAMTGGSADVKELGRRVAGQFTDDRATADGWRSWYTLDLDNYQIADTVRAFAEAEYVPITASSPPRWHAHAVSSAYGLLGYHLGHQILHRDPVLNLPAPAAHPGFLLVQHLATPDMVLSLATGQFSRSAIPHYRWSDAAAAWQQNSDPRFPAITGSLTDQVDLTFYTTTPPTSAAIDELIARHGGEGVVVSRRECEDRYAQIRELAEPFEAELPENPADLREWSLVMALCGVIVAHERSLLPPDVDVVVHATGSYTDELLPPMAAAHAVPVEGDEDLADLIKKALR